MKPPPTRASLLVLLAAGATACGHTETHAEMLRAPQAAKDRPAELYLADRGAPARPYYELALVQAIGFGTDATPEKVASALTERAGALGCDAVVRAYIDVGYSRAHAAGVCVSYLDGGQGTATPGTLPLLPKAPPPNPSPPAMRPAPAPRVEPLPSSPNQGR